MFSIEDEEKKGHLLLAAFRSRERRGCVGQSREDRPLLDVKLRISHAAVVVGQEEDSANRDHPIQGPASALLKIAEPRLLAEFTYEEGTPVRTK